MRPIISTIIYICLFVGLTCCQIHASGILPERINQIMIYAKVKEPCPVFYAIFSDKPISPSMQRTDLQDILKKRNRSDLLVLKLYGKQMEANGRISYFFGTAYDADAPWNNGQEFNWQNWEKYSPDIWDNIAIAYEPPAKQHTITSIHISDIVVRRGGKILFDTRATESYPNKTPISTKLPNLDLFPFEDSYPLLQLGSVMTSFKTAYYELKGNILETAYADLGQTDKNKYAKRGTAWCSEFASYVLRTNGIMTPDPNKSDVHWKNLREYFEKNGKVYTLREVASWPDSKKIQLIQPGTLVSFLTSEGTPHTALFTTWIHEKEKPISSYTGISGYNKEMVWAHEPLSLPPQDWAEGKTPKQIADFDNKCFFGVPK